MSGVGYYVNPVQVSTPIDSYASVYVPTTNKIYSFPYRVASSTLDILDVSTNIGISQLAAIPSGRYISATYAPNNNKIYALNMMFTNTPTFIAVYDVSAGTSTSISNITINVDSQYPPELAWLNGEYVSHNQCIYYMPHTDLNALVVNTTNNTVSYIPIFSPDFPGRYICGGVYSPATRRLYGIIHFAFYFLDVQYYDTYIINTNTNTLIIISTNPGFNSDAYIYRGGVLGANGKIYCLPDTETRILEIDPPTNTFTLIPTLNIGKTSSGALSPINNRIYASSGSGSSIIYEINTSNLTFKSTLTKPTTNAYSSLLFTNNGTMYATNADADAQLITSAYVYIGRQPLDQYYFINSFNAVVMPGTIIPYVGSSAPNGWRICDGSSYNEITNPQLDIALGFPATKVLPNLNAYFIRGSGTASNPNYAAGAVRTFQADSMKSHTHPVIESNHTHTYDFNPITDRANSGTRSGATATTTFNTTTTVVDISINPIGGAETRPYCYGVNYIIKLDSYDGLQFTIYNGYFADNVNWFRTAPRLDINGRNLEFSTNINSITNGTNGLVPSDSTLNLFSVQWLGNFYANVTGTWTFSTNSDDASYLWLGATALSGYTTSNPVVNNGGAHGPTVRTGTISLTAGTFYPIRIQFGDGGGGDVMVVSFTPPSGSAITNGVNYYYPAFPNQTFA